MEIILLNKGNENIWNNFCEESDDAWFWHTTKWLDYSLSYSEKDCETRNLSFMLKDDSRVIAVSPLLLEKKEYLDLEKYYYEFSTGRGGYGIMPALSNDLTENRRDKIMRLIFDQIDNLAKENNVSRTLLRSTPLSKRTYKYNIFMKYGYFDNSLNTTIIDISLSIEELWNNLRKGHKYDINRGKRIYQTTIYNKSNINKEVFDQYRLLHHKAAGRITRPIETFEMMYKWILSDEGILCALSKDSKYLGFTYVNLFKDGAYYSSSSDDPDVNLDVPISHIIQWEIIKWLKENGHKYYEMGIQQFSPQLYDNPTKKDMDISFFKRGFGGETVSLFRGEKFYNISYMEELLNNRNKALIKNSNI